MGKGEQIEAFHNCIKTGEGHEDWEEVSLVKTNLEILCHFLNYLLPSLFLHSMCVELGFGPDQHLVATDLRDKPTLIQETHKYT